MAFRLSARARRDLDAVLRYSLERYGRDAASRYQLLLMMAMEEVSDEPFLRWSRPVPGKQDVRSYSIAHSRRRLPRDQRVVVPAHQLVYRLNVGGGVEILAVVGDSYPAERITLPRGRLSSRDGESSE